MWSSAGCTYAHSDSSDTAGFALPSDGLAIVDRSGRELSATVLDVLASIVRVAESHMRVTPPSPTTRPLLAFCSPWTISAPS